MKRVYISCYENSDYIYKEQLLQLNNLKNNSLFIPVLSNEKDFYLIEKHTVNDDFIYSIKKNILKNADIAIFLIGLDSSKRKTIDWELRASFIETSILKKCGIVIIYLPDVTNKYGSKIPRSILPKLLQKNLTLNSVFIVETTWRKIFSDVNDFEKILNVGFAYGQMSQYVSDDKILINNQNNFKKQ